ncbi:MAG TPA: hypothetical protein VGM94_02630, partial [Galbitalea sp.]
MSRSAVVKIAPAAIMAIVGVTVAIAAVTILIFLVRAGDAGGTNWPTDFELRSSDNGVLFQFSQDVFAGRSLDWSFSPQVYVFPEIPISLAAYLTAGGTVQLYYLFVAAINNALLFLGLFAVIRMLFPADAVGRQLARAVIATFPLLLLPLIGTTWLFSYQVAPTYYFGMYLMIFVAPALYLACRLPTKIAIGLGIALTAASNPLALVFTVPALVIVLVVQAFTRGIRAILRPAAWSAGVLVVALVVRLTLFSRLQGASPFAYVDSSIFSGRLLVIRTYLEGLVADPATAIILYLGALAAAAGIVVAIVVIVRLARNRMQWGPRTFVTLYYALVPVTGLAGTFALIITDYLYFWPVLIAPLVFVLVPLPARWVPFALPATALALVVAGTMTGGAGNLASASGYFTYRSDETRCLDSRLPAGDDIGYATFSDARRLELTSARPVRLIQLKSSGVRAYWLTNRDYARDNV